MKILPLVGLKSLRAFNAFNSLLLGLEMLPDNLSVPYPEFFEAFKDKSDTQKEDALRQAVAFVPLTPEEIEAFAAFATDDNGIAYTKHNIANLKPDQILELVVAIS